jgi:hypothetical protein
MSRRTTSTSSEIAISSQHLCQVAASACFVDKDKILGSSVPDGGEGAKPKQNRKFSHVDGLSNGKVQNRERSDLDRCPWHLGTLAPWHLAMQLRAGKHASVHEGVFKIGGGLLPASCSTPSCSCATTRLRTASVHA